MWEQPVFLGCACVIVQANLSPYHCFIFTIGVFLADDNHLNGTLPSELSLLTELKYLRITNAAISGTIPDSLGTLSRLAYLQLSGISFNSSIPNSFSNLRKLEEIKMYFCDLTGTIPSGLFQITGLKNVILSFNGLNGTLPEVTGLDKLETMTVGSNQFTGTIPKSLFSPQMEVLNLFDNQFIGSIDSNDILRLKDLKAFDIWYNDITGRKFMLGPIGVYILHDSTELISVLLFIDFFCQTGTIPTEFGLLSDLKWMAFAQNILSGTIPSELGLLDQLTNLIVYDNELTGTVPWELSLMTNLKGLRLSQNMLTGDMDPFCDRNDLFTQIDADCGVIMDENGKDNEPEVDCPCCATCCNDASGECVANLQGVCAIHLNNHEHEDGRLYFENSGTICNCESEGDDVDDKKNNNGNINRNFTLSCADTQCETCNKEGTVCAINQDYQYEYNGDDGSEAYYKATFQYTVGRDDVVIFEEFKNVEQFECVVSVNGQRCRNCLRQYCDRNGYHAYKVDCENVPGAGNVDACDEILEDDGALAIIALQDFVFLDGCPPRLPILLD